MNNEFTFKTQVEWTNDFNGTLTEETLPSLEVTTPPEFSVGKENTWTPEHLFVASVNVCLMTTFLAIAKNSKLNFSSYKSYAKGKLEKADGKFLFTEITLFPEIKVSLEKDIERTGRILKKAEQHCLVSNSIKTEIILQPNITLE